MGNGSDAKGYADSRHWKIISEGDLEIDSGEARAQAQQAKKRKAREFEKLAAEIEEWAMRMIQEGEQDGCRKVSCNGRSILPENKSLLKASQAVDVLWMIVFSDKFRHGFAQ